MVITLTRQQLYNRVWSDPIHTLSKEFGLSDVGLAKACRRHQIPVEWHASITTAIGAANSWRRPRSDSDLLTPSQPRDDVDLPRRTRSGADVLDARRRGRHCPQRGARRDVSLIASHDWRWLSVDQQTERVRHARH